MANHLQPANTDTYVNYTPYIMGRVDDAVKMNSTALTTQPSNLPTDAVRWDATNFGWYKNTGTAGTPTWTTPLSTRYSINIDGTVGANAPTTVTCTTLTVNGPTAASGAGLTALFATPPIIGGGTANAGTFTNFQATGTCVLPDVARRATAGDLLVGTTATQTLSGKTLTAPAILSIVNGTGTLTIPNNLTDTLVTRTATETLSGKTLTAPRFITGGRIDDENGNEQIGFTTTTSAVTFLNITNGATGVAPSITGAGQTDTSLNLKSTGLGTVQANGVTLADLSSTQPLSNKTLTASAFNGTIGVTTPSSIDCTTLNVGTSVSGAGFATLFASPAALGSTTPNSIAATTGTFAGNVTPTTTNTRTLGSASLVWNNVYATTLTGALVGNASTATTFSTTRAGWVGNTATAVCGEMGWKNYGNNHTIFDASASTSPAGGVVNNSNPTSAWAATYPTLMGWNGTSTYGVRVDSSRVTDALATVTGSAPSYAIRAWVNFNGTGTVAIRASGNVGSVGDAGTGIYNINFTTGLPNASYSVTAGLATTADAGVMCPRVRASSAQGVPVSKTTGTVQVAVMSSNNYYDANDISVTIIN